MGKNKIFFSWQSHDHVSRNFISNCLNRLERDNVELVEVQRDTGGIPGSPNIEGTIFQRIDDCDLLVADLTPFCISDDGKKAYPNPNVLIELGYAMHVLGENRIIMLFCEDNCSKEMMPFDINHRRLTGFSPKNPDGKKKLVSQLSRTVSQLNDLEDIHSRRKNAERTILCDLILKGIDQIWKWHVQTKKREGYDGSFIPITDPQIAMIEIVRDALTLEQYHLLHQIINLLKCSLTGTEECYGDKYASDLIDLCFEPLAIEYCTQLPDVPVWYYWKEHIVMLYNALAGMQKQIEFSSMRSIEVYGKQQLLLVSSDGYEEAYTADGTCLCKCNKDENGLITGYKVTPKYTGEFLNGTRHGKGTSFYHTGFRNNHLENQPMETGYWENDIFVEGTLHQMAVLKRSEENNDWELLRDDDGAPLTVFSDNVGYYLTSCEFEGTCVQCISVDMHLKDDQVEMIEGTERPLCVFLGGEVVPYHCQECRFKE